jgi:hypothetical protein
MRAARLSTAGMACLALLAAGPGDAHPEDEFCVPGETALDPELCAALTALDSSDKEVPELAPLLDAAGAERGFAATAGLYVAIGIRHILPAGLDHILFVLALFFSSPTLRALLWQISAFTVAHTATLGLAAAGVIAPPAAVVEPLIAASIAFVAFESLYFRSRLPRWRLLVVFLFGLVHGLGFAGFFGELGLPPRQFWSALLGFNIGVEIGQLGVIAAAAALAAVLQKRLAVIHEPGGWRRRVVVPATLAIGFTGAFWTVQRLAGVLNAG